MTASYYFLYGTLQGMLEFLPVSSSGNFSLLRTFFIKPLGDIPQALEWILHGASLGAVLYVFKREIFLVVKSAYVQLLQPGGGFIELSNRPAVKYFLFLILSTFPSVYAATYRMDTITDISFGISRYCFELGIGFIITSSVLWVAFFFAQQTNQPIAEKSWLFPLVIGVAQSIAVGRIGVSRSGLCLSACLLMGVPAAAAFRYTFLLAIPLYLGAFLQGSVYNKDSWINMDRGVFFGIIGALGCCLIVSVLFLTMIKKIWDKKSRWLLAGCAIYTGFLALVCVLKGYVVFL